MKKCRDLDHVIEFAWYPDDNYVVECTSCGDIIVEWNEREPMDVLDALEQKSLEHKFSFDIYRSAVDQKPVVHVETPGIKDNADGPDCRVYLNDDIENPIWGEKI
jgi:hypothetical protein